MWRDRDESPPQAVCAAHQADARFVIAVDVTLRLETAQADIALEAGLPWEASPWPSDFRLARRTGETSARRQLPQLRARLQALGLAPERDSSSP